MLELRDYQQHAVDCALKETNNTIISAATGSGKSLIIAALAKRIPGNILIFQPTKEILEQNVNHYRDIVDDNFSVLSASTNSFDVGKITFSTIGTAKNRISLFTRNLDLIIVDECHNMPLKRDSMYMKFLKEINYKGRIIGLTATPYRIEDNTWDSKNKMSRPCLKVLTEIGKENKGGPFWKSICCDENIQMLIERDFLIKPQYKLYDNQEKLRLLQTNNNGRLTQECLRNWDEQNELIITGACKEAYSLHKKIICFVNTIEVAESITNRLKNSGIHAEYVASTRSYKEVNKIIQNFRETQEKTVLINVNQLTEGFDVKPCDAVILGTPTSSLRRYQQRVGRCIRPWPNKKPVVYDVARSSEKFGKVENIQLAKKKTGEYLVLKKEGDKLKVLSGWLNSVEKDRRQAEKYSWAYRYYKNQSKYKKSKKKQNKRRK